ncbi:MAG: phenylalanine--tRNA ligase subunit beta [Gammaproteobacteria bacterium]|nr:phenylalanine--tRNA ligase subunit beta [Gammaproteobacteria bacterium]
MKFSEQWLREWVNPSISTAELAEQLTMAGLEVDAIEAVAGAFDHVVVGEVLSLEKHPDADKLRVCQVNVGDKAPLQIVCGAANVHAGMKAPVALIGANLPGDLKIKKSKLRGVESFGMLCSAKELGLAESADGLLPLSADAPVGQSVRDYLQLDDVSLELGLTPNRGDCLGLEGVAREVAVLNRMTLKSPDISPVTATIRDTFPVKLTEEKDCPQYCGRVIRGINPRALTPFWMQERLRRSGLRSVSPVVDVTNYVLLELGQPMHAFDLAKLRGGIEVRHARQGEKLLLLDGQTMELQQETLVIADSAGPLALAGIMGGEESAVRDDTVDIFLESAFFNPLTIAGKARSYGLHTDSSHRFERGVSPELQPRAIERATALLLEIVGGKPGPVVKTQNPALLPTRAPIQLREARVGHILGNSIPAAEIEDILSRLGMSLTQKDSAWEVKPPAFRFDISIEEDLVEEVARIYGYNRLKLEQPLSTLTIGRLSESRLALRRIREVLVDLGYQEAVTYSFVDPRYQQALDPDVPAIALANPISADMSVMRTNLWAGLVQAVQYNLNRQQNRLSLFECGLKFVKQANDLKQEMVVAGLLTGKAVPEQWGESKRAVDFYDVKGALETLFELTGCFSRFNFSSAQHPALHPGQSARIFRDDVPVGWLGAIHPQVAKSLDIDQTMYLFELTTDSLQRGSLPTYQAVSKYPAVRRDLAIVVDKAVSAQNVQDCIRKAAPQTLVKVELFDMYTGEGIDSGRKSLALGLTLQDLSRTLTESDVETVQQRVVEQLQKDLGATLRQ